MEVICSREGFFNNPQKLPLNELNFKYTSLHRVSKNEVSPEEITEKNSLIKWQDRYQIKEEKKPALDKCWLSPEKRFVKFHPFYPQFSDKENEEFLKRNREFLESIDFLNTCSYHQFWCYITCEPRICVIIKSFLENCISPHATMNLNAEFLHLYNQIYSSICCIYERLLKFNVSPTEHMSESFVLPFLKRSKLLNVRAILILCYIYNHSKPQFVKNMIDFYFCKKYKEAHMKELEDMLMDVLQEFEKLDKLLLSPNCSYTLYKTDMNDPVWLEHTSSYLLDEVASIQEFLSVYKPTLDIALDLQLPQHLPHIYQKVYVQFYDILEKKDETKYDWSRCEMLINQWLTAGRAEFVNLFHTFMKHLYDKILSYKNECSEQERHLEIFFELISGAFDDDLFIKDYNKVHPIKSQFQLLIDNVSNFDKTQSDYLLEILENIIVEEPEDEDFQDGNSNPPSQKGITYQNGESSKSNASSIVDEEVYGSIYDTLSEFLDIQQSSAPPAENKALPEVVQIALKQYVQLMKTWENNMDSSSDSDAGTSSKDSLSINVNKPSKEELDKRVKSVLEMLPNLEVDYIKKCLEMMDYRPEQVISRILDNELPLDLQTSQYSETNKSGSNKEIWPKLVPIVSKKSNNRDAINLLDDKKEKQDIKNLVLKASYAYDLDDDYDDRNEMYNGNENIDESKIYRHLKQSDLPECDAISDPSSSSEDEEAAVQNQKPRDAFCEDPAIVRARREAQRNSRIFRGTNRNNTNQSSTQKDQEANVKHSRDKKNTHKATRANHNRKGGAQWKRNKGMFPS